MTAEELQAAEEEYRAGWGRAELFRQARNETVRQALAEGWTHAAIAEVTGLSRGRINQIAQSR